MKVRINYLNLPLRATGYLRCAKGLVAIREDGIKKRVQNKKKMGLGPQIEFLYNTDLLSSKSLYLQWLQTPFRNASKYAPRVPLNGLQFSKNWQLRPLFLAYFYLPNQNHETFINSHFQILEG